MEKKLRTQVFLRYKHGLITFSTLSFKHNNKHLVQLFKLTFILIWSKWKCMKPLQQGYLFVFSFKCLSTTEMKKPGKDCRQIKQRQKNIRLTNFFLSSFFDAVLSIFCKKLSQLCLLRDVKSVANRLQVVIPFYKTPPQNVLNLRLLKWKWSTHISYDLTTKKSQTFTSRFPHD